MPSRRVIDLDPRMQPLAMLFATRMAEAGIPFIFTCTLRTQEEQDLLFQIGRRGIEGEKPVTWTKNSLHLYGLAFDIAIMKDRKPTWDTKISVNDNEIPDFIEAGHIGRKCGLKWGGDFGDMPHFEWKEEA